MKLKLKAVISLALALVVLFGTTAAATPAFAPKATATTTAKNNNANQHALILSVPRGGAGPLDPALTAKGFLGACAVTGVYGYLAPNKALGLIGIDDVDDASILIAGLNGSHLVMFIIAVWGALFVSGLSTIQAIGAAQIPFIVSVLRSILNGDAEAAGFSMPGWWTDLAIHSFASHACLSGAGYAATAVKVLAVYLSLANTQCRLAPGAALKRMGINDSTSKMAFVTKLMAHQGLEGALCFAALASGVDAYKALVYSQIVALLSFVLFIASGDFDDHGFAKTFYIWILLKAAVVVTLAF